VEEAAREGGREPRQASTRAVGGRSRDARAEEAADATSKARNGHSSSCETALVSLLGEAGLTATRRLATKVFFEFPDLRGELSADDLHSACWVRVMKSGNSFEGRSVAQALAWFAQAARNTALDLLRESPPLREYRWNLESRPTANITVSASPARMPSDEESSLESCTHDRRLIAGSRCPVAHPSLTSRDNVAEIRAAIERLGSRAAEVLRLNAVEERTLRGVASHMNMETKQVSMTLWRARESIRALLPEDLGRIVDFWSARRESRELLIEARKSGDRGGASPRVPESQSPRGTEDQRTRGPGNRGPESRRVQGPTDRLTTELADPSRSPASRPGQPSQKCRRRRSSSSDPRGSDASSLS
jgi:RNA polymerase sigma factor (sigma-70 family)